MHTMHLINRMKMNQDFLEGQQRYQPTLRISSRASLQQDSSGGLGGGGRGGVASPVLRK